MSYLCIPIMPAHGKEAKAICRKNKCMCASTKANDVWSGGHDILGAQFGYLKDRWHHLPEIRKSEGKAGRGGEWAK